MIRRGAETLCELLAETTLLGFLFGMLIIPGQMSSLTALAASALPVVVVLYLHGYYLTRPIAGLLWKKNNPWLYAVVSASLFAIHISVGFARLRPDMAPEAASKFPVFLVCGACIVFCCAAVGKSMLAKLDDRSKRSA
jgi:hypothetical protein